MAETIEYKNRNNGIDYKAKSIKISIKLEIDDKNTYKVNLLNLKMGYNNKFGARSSF